MLKRNVQGDSEPESEEKIKNTISSFEKIKEKGFNVLEMSNNLRLSIDLMNLDQIN